MADFNTTRNPTLVQSSGGGTAWSNPSYAGIQDGNYATSDIGKNDVTQWLQPQQYGFNIESDATIVGIKMDVYHYSENSGNVSDSQVYLLDTASGHKGSNYATGSGIPTSPTWKTFGGPTDLWGASWTYSDINNANFGAHMEYSNDSGTSRRQIHVDVVTMTVYYTRPDFAGIILQMGVM